MTSCTATLPQVTLEVEKEVAGMTKPELNKYINDRLSLIQNNSVKGERLEAIKIEARFAAIKLLNRG